MSTYTIRDYQGADEADVLNLLISALGEGGSFARTVDFWRWKHFENPFGASQVLVAANQEILGLRAFMRWGFVSPGGGRLHAVRAVDTATDPAHRRLGIFGRLTSTALDRARADGVNLIFNTPNPQSMAGYLKLGWQRVGQPRLLVKVLRPLRIPFGLAFKRSRRLTPEVTASFFPVPPTPVAAIFEYGEYVARMLRFEDELCADGIRTERTLEFIRWRYCSAPSLPYYALWSGERPMTGLFIFRPNLRRGLREIMLCELWSGYGSLPHLQKLTQRLRRTVRADYLVASATPGSQQWWLLRRGGFIPLPERVGPVLTVLPLNWPEGTPDPRQLKNWRLSLGDLEVF